MKFYDLSLPLSEQTPEWPGDTKYLRQERKSSAIVSKLVLSTHFGTHIDAPKHFLFLKSSVDLLPLNALVGEFKVFDLKISGSKAALINLFDIKKFAIKAGDRIIFKTRNSKIITQKKFTAQYVSLSLDVAKFLAQKGVALVGIDYFGIEAKSAPGHPVHKILLEKGIVIVEGLNLSKVPQGQYSGAILPLKIDGADGSPCRAVFWRN